MEYLKKGVSKIRVWTFKNVEIYTFFSTTQKKGYRMVYIIKLLDHPQNRLSKIFVDYVDIVDKLIYNIIVKILQAPNRDKQLIPQRRKYENKITWKW